jgi:hypothetical protein
MVQDRSFIGHAKIGCCVKIITDQVKRFGVSKPDQIPANVAAWQCLDLTALDYYCVVYLWDVVNLNGLANCTGCDYCIMRSLQAFLIFF